MRILPLTLSLALALPAGVAPARVQIRVNPTGVNVNAQGATTVFLTFGGLAGFEPVEAFWCGELIQASPAVGLRCAPGTLFGQLPLRFDRSTLSGTGGFTDIMTIPPSVSRRAYQAAEEGATSSFFYVRRFRNLSGGPDEYVAVTCRLTGGGARSPLALTDVRLSFVPAVPVLQLAAGEVPPAIEAKLTYTGTGRLIGRWEVVLPGEELPTTDDLLTEATLPRERRGSQRRYTQLARFNQFLPPAGSVVLPGPAPDRLPTGADGAYYLLLRIEATSDKEGDSNLGTVGAGTGVIQAGAVAGFPMPVLRYLVGSGQAIAASESDGRPGPSQVSPAPGARLQPDSLVFIWRLLSQAALYQLEIESDAGAMILSALVPGAIAGYRAPPWLAERLPGGQLRWRVVATDAGGRYLGRSGWRTARITLPQSP